MLSTKFSTASLGFTSLACNAGYSVGGLRKPDMLKVWILFVTVLCLAVALGAWLVASAGRSGPDDNLP